MKLNLVIGQSSRDSKVTLNDVDITNVTKKVEFSCAAGELSEVTLTLVPGVGQLTVNGLFDGILGKDAIQLKGKEGV